MEEKIQKNDVSYFESGFKAAMIIFGGFTKEEVERKFYSTTLFPNMVRHCLALYDVEESHSSGEENMLNNL